MKLKTSVGSKKELTPTEKLAALMEQINAQYGDGTVLLASKAKGMAVRHLSSGVVRLDIALAGGFPEGRIIEIFGAESSGKTTLTLATIAQFQKKYRNGIATFIDLEKSFDPNYAEQWGVDLERLVLVNPDSGEQAADLITAVMVQDEFEVLVVVDSIAGMVPTAELEESASVANVGQHPRLINKTMRLCTARMKRSLADPTYPTTTVIFLNQLRQKIGIMFGNPETTPGGLGKNFFCSVRLRLFSGVGKKARIQIARTVGGITRNELYARIVSFEVVKNKCGGVPFVQGEYTSYVKPYQGNLPWTFDNIQALFDYGVYHRIIQKFMDGKVAKWRYVNPSGDDIIAAKEFSFVADLRADEEAQTCLLEEIMAAVKKSNSGEMEEAEKEEEVEEGGEKEGAAE